MENVTQLFDDFASVKVGVVGDVMLDTYMWGAVERISPEAPVPVVSLHKKEQRIGGAGNVALNLQALGAKAFVLSVTGDDDDAQCLNQLFAASGINTGYCFQSESRITTNKTRVISRNQQMMRLDAEITNDLTTEDEEHLLQNFQRFIATEKPQVVILEDYNKGVLTENVIHSVIALCKEAGIITAVDPKRKNFFAFKGVDIFKPNLKEVKEALNYLHVDAQLPLLKDIHHNLQNFLHHRISFITLSEKGVFYQEEDSAAIIPSHLRSIADVSGAGDTVIAVASLVYAVKQNPYLMAEIANIAGGLVCEEVGTAAIDKLKLLHECELLLS
ncbi:bifunctional heptose 7-phosphate kinase/heptose 1-phosphate adenyltransferase [Flavisolibacter ginsenosidimutans]|uniref:Carbohydrate kinase n=1 Tax=Flavisolibacter ginsenosidimutans TaxID=661481 RepID=A0A5B8UQ14_9BACT|nr:PfkB family carbohydrate kinase [Flavisolibacter ginsenosidimutans]QEC58339.1 carbohydrate kinase [Flavisolibacter ginsenosidimutans]